jgi:hypothetical protein
MRSLTENKKGQFDFPLITFAIIVIGLLIIAPIVLKVVRGTVTPISESLGNMSVASGAQASANMNYVLGVYVSFWDGVIMFAFLEAVILLFISAFLIDANPFFMLLYILLLFLTIVFAPEILEAVDRIYEANAFAEEVALVGMTDFLRLNFGLVLTIIGVLTMIIIYAKVRYFPSEK